MVSIWWAKVDYFVDKNAQCFSQRLLRVSSELNINKRVFVKYLTTSTCVRSHRSKEQWQGISVAKFFQAIQSESRPLLSTSSAGHRMCSSLWCVSELASVLIFSVAHSWWHSLPPWLHAQPQGSGLLHHIPLSAPSGSADLIFMSAEMPSSWIKDEACELIDMFYISWLSLKGYMAAVVTKTLFNEIHRK